MKILNVNHIIDPVTGGGTAERTFQMSQQLINHGEDCTILCLVDAKEKRTLRGGKIVVLPVLLRRFLIPKYLFAGIYKVVKEADVVHLMGHWTLLNAMVYLIVRLLKKPYVMCPAGALAIFGRSKNLKRIYNFIIGKKIVSNAAKCIATTDLEKQQFVDYDVDPNNVILIPNSIAIPEMPPLSENKFREKFAIGKKPFILFLGRLSLIKGPDLLVTAFCAQLKKLEQFDLVVAGPDDGMLDDLKEIVKKNNATDRVHFIGFLGGMDKLEAYQAATILAIPSRQEAMSLVVLEAGAVGTPAIFTDQCGLDQFAKDGCGWMVPPTVEGLTEGMSQALSNLDNIQAMGQRVFQYIQKNYSWPAVIKIYQKMYRELI